MVIDFYLAQCIARQRVQDRLREAGSWHMVRAGSMAGQGSPPLLYRLLAGLGRALVILGYTLERRFDREGPLPAAHTASGSR
jgi:hypothetical protein